MNGRERQGKYAPGRIFSSERSVPLRIVPPRTDARHQMLIRNAASSSWSTETSIDSASITSQQMLALPGLMIGFIQKSETGRVRRAAYFTLGLEAGGEIGICYSRVTPGIPANTAESGGSTGIGSSLERWRSQIAKNSASVAQRRISKRNRSPSTMPAPIKLR